MELINHTDLRAEMIGTSAGEDELMASLVTRAAYRIEGEMLVLDSEQDWTVHEPPMDKEFGEFEAETPFAKEGVDVFVLGAVYPSEPGGSRGRFELRVDGEPMMTIHAYGERRWRRERKRFVATKPAPFDRIPLSWNSAYGGVSKLETGDMPYHANDLGRGYFFEESLVDGGALPLLEDPLAEVSEWTDQPSPVATAPCPRKSSLRAQVGVLMDEEGDVPKVRCYAQAAFNQADPRMVIARENVHDGMTFEADGALPNGRSLRFTLPSDPLHLHVQLDAREYVFPAVLDTIAILPDEARVVIGSRCTFTYPLVELERRAASLRMGPLPKPIPPEYAVDWKARDEAERRAWEKGE